MRQFEKNLTNIGNSTGVIIPSWILKAENIAKGQKVRILIEPIDGPGGNCTVSYSQVSRRMLTWGWPGGPEIVTIG